MNRESKLGGTFSLPGTPLNLYRMGYGAMQLAGPGVWGLPPNIDEAAAVLRDAVGAGVNHIDTSDFYGPSVTNQLIKQVLHPYPDDLVIITKVGYRRGSAKSWLPALLRQELIQAVEGNLRNLGLDVLDVVNLRVGGNTGPIEGSIEEPMNVLAELKRRGLIRHLGVSNVTPQQFIEAQKIAPIVCVQNFYNVANRHDDEFIDELAKPSSRTACSGFWRNTSTRHPPTWIFSGERRRKTRAQSFYMKVFPVIIFSWLCRGAIETQSAAIFMIHRQTKA